MKNEKFLLQKKENVSLLFLCYQGLLTSVVKRRMEAVYLMDYSIGEVAENEGVSRNAVFESLEAGIKKLEQYEKKLGLCQKYEKVNLLIDQVKNSSNPIERNKLLDEMKGELGYGI